jgi:hypothetical protein
MRVLLILTWIALPTVMYGGYSLLALLNRGNVLTPFQVSQFRAGHAHAGVLLLLALLYQQFLLQTPFSAGTRLVLAAALLVAIMAQSGGFFLHMLVGKPQQASLGTRLTMTGAVVLALAVLVLVYGLIMS